MNPSLVKNSGSAQMRKLRAHAYWCPVGALIAILLIVLFITPMFSNTVMESTPVAFTTQTVQDPTTELGNTTVKQMGANGAKTTTYSQHKSLFNLLFGTGKQNKLTEEYALVTTAPIQEIVGSGTEKYQYMYCSNGTYRYFTNAQFASPSVGFTHKSPDYCSQNNAGTETQLANTPPAPAATHAPTNTDISSFTIPDCTTTSIPYGVDYENASWLPTGQTQVYPGLNGTYFSCLGSSVQPVNETIYEGTGQDYNVLAQEEAASEARDKCTEQYNSAMAQIDAAGAAGSSATIELQSLYNQCLNRAG